MLLVLLKLSPVIGHVAGAVEVKSGAVRALSEIYSDSPKLL
jgi:hypothetical protein